VDSSDAFQQAGLQGEEHIQGVPIMASKSCREGKIENPSDVAAPRNRLFRVTNILLSGSPLAHTIAAGNCSAHYGSVGFQPAFQAGLSLEYLFSPFLSG
jgi:hypothetical protein